MDKVQTMNSAESSVLGSTIQTVRRSKKITQEELGKKLGLSKSSVSKIEKGLTHITAEDAMIMLEAMGETLVIQVPGMDGSLATREQKSRFLTTSVSWFAHAKGIECGKAYTYLLMYKGIDFLDENFRYEQTLPQSVVIDDLTRICAKNGGTL